MTVETRWSGLTVTDWLEGGGPRRSGRRRRAALGNSRSTLVRVLTGHGRRRGSSSRRGPSSARCRSGCSRSATGCSCSAATSRSRSSRRASSGTSSTTAATTRARAVVDLAAAGGRVAVELRFDSQSLDPHPDSIDDRQAARRAAVARLGGEPAAAGDGDAGGAAQRADAAGALPRSRPARSSPPRRPRCRRSSAACATGTTATAGCATRRCPRACWSTSAPWTEAEALLRWVDGCIDRTGGHPERLHPLYTVDGHRARARRRSSTRCPATPARGRCASATRPTGRSSSTSSGPIADLLAAVVEARGSVRDERLARRRGRWCRPSSGAGTSPTTASGRPGCRRATTSTRRSCAG